MGANSGQTAGGGLGGVSAGPLTLCGTLSKLVTSQPHLIYKQDRKHLCQGHQEGGSRKRRCPHETDSVWHMAGAQRTSLVHAVIPLWPHLIQGDGQAVGEDAP